MLKIIDISFKDSLKRAVRVLSDEGILVFPTDTVYGIGCLINEKAIKKLYFLKHRPQNQPTAILFSKKIYTLLRSSIKSHIDIPANIHRDFRRGKTTLIFPTRQFEIDFPSMIIKDDKVGIRLPKDQWLEDLIDRVGPIVTSSANRKDRKAPKNFQELDERIINEADLTIKTDKILSGKPSSVYDIENKSYIRI